MGKKKQYDKENRPVVDPKYLNYSQERAYAKGKMDPEERLIHEENLEHRDNWSYDGVKALQAAICYQAVADYQREIRHRKWAKQKLKEGGDKEAYTDILNECERRLADCRRFFRDDLFQNVVHVKDIYRLCHMIEAHKEKHNKPCRRKEVVSA